MNSIEEDLFEAQESSLLGTTAQDDFHLNLDEIDLSLLRLSSSPDSLREIPRNSHISSATAFAGESSPVKRPSPDSGDSDQPKRRKISVQKQDLMSPPVFSGYPEITSSPDSIRLRDPPRLAPVILRRSLFDGYSSPVSEKQETAPFRSKSFSEKTTLEENPGSKMLTMINDRVKEMNQWCKDLVCNGEGHSHKELEDASKTLKKKNQVSLLPLIQETQEQDSERDSEEGMRIERSGDGYVIRLKCPCRQAYRVLFSDSHFYFKLL